MKMINKNKAKNAGFTLIELIATVSIATILASIAVPSFSKMIERNRITTGTNELISSLILARSEALKRSINVSLCASNNDTNCNANDFSEGWIVFVDCGSDGVINNNGCPAGITDVAIKVHEPVRGMAITKNGPASYYGYNFAGRGAANTFTITPNSGRPATTFSVSRTGRIR